MKRSLFICLLLLFIIACQDKSKKSPPAAPTPEVANTPIDPVLETPDIPLSAAPTPPAPALPGPVAPVTPPVHECATYVVDFDRRTDGVTLRKGAKIKDQFKDLGIQIEAEKRLSNGALIEGDAILFDSAERPTAKEKAQYKAIDCEYGNCYGFDAMLSTPKNGKALIIAEHTYSEGAASIVSYPDDNSRGGVLSFRFAKPTSIINLDLVNFQSANSSIRLYTKDADGSFIEKSSQPISALAPGKLQNVTVNDHDYIDLLKLNLAAVGSLDNLKICIKN